MDILVRQAETRDAKMIVELTQLLAALHGDTTSVNENYVLDYLILNETGVIVAEVEDQVVGLASYLIKPDLYEGGSVSIIEELVVAEPHRAKGIGKKLLNAVLGQASAKGVKTAVITVDKKNKIAQEMYYKAGFQDVGDLLLYKDLRFV